MKKYGAGSLDRTLKLQVKTQTMDERGSEVEQWADYVGRVPCAAEFAGSREFPLSIKRFSESTRRFVIRYRDDIDSATMRILYEENPGLMPPAIQVFDIFPPEHIQERRSYTAIEAKETK